MKAPTILLCLGAVLQVLQVNADVKLGVWTAGPNTAGLTAECIGMLNEALNCDGSLVWANNPNTFYTDDILSALCTTTCKDSLTSYVSRIQAACGSGRYDGGDGFSYLAAYKAELVLENFNIVCLVNPAGQRCNRVLGKLAGIDPNRQLSTAPPAAGLMCDACAISMVKTQLEMPLASNTDISRGFASITASCKTAVSVTPPKTTLQWVVSATTTTGTTRTTTSSTTGTPGACQGKTYTIQSGDTCTSVSLSQRIGTTQLLAANNLRADCASFPQSGTVCIPSSATCEPHKVSFQNPRESCADLARAANATMLQLVAWNSELGTDCANINRQTAGYTVCLSPPGGSWSDPHPNSTASATTTSIDTIFTLSMTPIPTSFITTGIVAYPNGGSQD